MKRIFIVIFIVLLAAFCYMTAIFVFHSHRSETNLNSFLDGKQTQVDPRLLTHLVGDLFARESGLEGADPKDILSYLQELTELRLQAEAIPSLSRWRDKLKNAQILLTAFRQSDEAFKQELLSQYEQLKEGESLFWPGGWHGHAVSYYLIKESKTRLTFRVYNIGEGAENHLTVVCGSKELIKPYRQISNIPVQEFLHPVFLTLLRDLKFTEDAEMPVKSDDLYLAVFSLVQGENADDHLAEELTVPQSSGLCAYLSIMAALPYELNDPALAAQIRFEMEFKALWDFFLSIQSEDNPTPYWNLFEKSLFYFQIAAHKQYGGHLPPFIHRRLEQMQSFSRLAIEEGRKAHFAIRQKLLRGALGASANAPSSRFTDFPHAVQQGSYLFVPRLQPVARASEWLFPLLDPSAESEARLFKYEIKGPELLSHETEANLYLALLYLYLQQYEKAQMLLNAVSKQTFNADSQEILQWIIQSMLKTHDRDPRANALYLKAVVLAGDTKAISAYALKVCYYDYLQNIDLFAEPLLSAEEEEKLISFFPRQTVRMKKPAYYVIGRPTAKPTCDAEPLPAQFLEAWEQSRERPVCSLIRPCVLGRFEAYYRLARHGIWSSLLGERQLSHPKDIVRLFSVLKSCSLTDADRWAASLLQRVATHPELFPSMSRLHDILKKRSLIELEQLLN